MLICPQNQTSLPSTSSFEFRAPPARPQSATMRDNASTSWRTCALTLVSPVRPPTSPEIPSMCSMVRVRVTMLSRRARTFSEVSTCAPEQHGSEQGHDTARMCSHLGSPSTQSATACNNGAGSSAPVHRTSCCNRLMSVAASDADFVSSSMLLTRPPWRSSVISGVTCKGTRCSAAAIHQSLLQAHA